MVNSYAVFFDAAVDDVVTSMLVDPAYEPALDKKTPALKWARGRCQCCSVL